MKKNIVKIIIMIFCFIFFTSFPSSSQQVKNNAYIIGVGDLLEFSILQPEKSTNKITVSPDGTISIPYIGNVVVKGFSVEQVQQTIQTRLAQGYLQYPIVSLTLIESRSRTFTITGAVMKPGTYTLTEDKTVLKAITEAGWFTRFASQSKVKVLRPRENRPGYTHIKVDITEILNGDTNIDIQLKPGDIVVVPE